MFSDYALSLSCLLRGPLAASKWTACSGCHGQTCLPVSSRLAGKMGTDGHRLSPFSLGNWTRGGRGVQFSIPSANATSLRGRPTHRKPVRKPFGEHKPNIIIHHDSGLAKSSFATKSSVCPPLPLLSPACGWRDHPSRPRGDRGGDKVDRRSFRLTASSMPSTGRRT